jgi:hypothetical protein
MSYLRRINGALRRGCRLAPAGDEREAVAHVIQLDVFGTVVRLPRELVALLRTAAAARAGASSIHRDLSLVLDRALGSGSATLTRGDLRALGVIGEEEPEPFAEAVRQLQEAARREG